MDNTQLSHVEQTNGVASRVNGEKPKSINAGKSLPKRVVKIAGDDYIVCFSMYGYQRLNQECGRNLFLDGGLDLDPLKSSPEDYTMLIWAGLVTGRPELTLDDLAKILTTSDVIAIMPQITEALAASLPTRIGGEEKKREKQKISTALTG
jgi:hypothetical protein